MHIVALIMLAIMSWTVRTKYTAVGRKEIIVFFYLYGAVELLAIFLDSGIIPTSSNTYPVGKVSGPRLTRAVVRRRLRRSHMRYVLVSGRQRLRRLPVC